MTARLMAASGKCKINGFREGSEIIVLDSRLQQNLRSPRCLIRDLRSHCYGDGLKTILDAEKIIDPSTLGETNAHGELKRERKSFLRKTFSWQTAFLFGPRLECQDRFELLQVSFHHNNDVK